MKVSRLCLFIGDAVHPDAELNALLERRGIRPVCIEGVRRALRLGGDMSFDGAVADAALLYPGQEPWLLRLRAALRCPLMVVADHADEFDEILALEQGADAYVDRPHSSRLFGARLAALLRRRVDAPTGGDPAPATVEVAGWTFDPALRTLSRGAAEVPLTDLLAALFAHLLANHDRVVSREQLLHRLHRVGSRATVDGVDTYVHRLRTTLARARVTGFQIEAVRGRGYALRGPRARAFDGRLRQMSTTES